MPNWENQGGTFGKPVESVCRILRDLTVRNLGLITVSRQSFTFWKQSTAPWSNCEEVILQSLACVTFSSQTWQ